VISSGTKKTSSKVLNARAKEAVGNQGFELHSAASSLLEQYKQQSASHCESFAASAPSTSCHHCCFCCHYVPVKDLDRKWHKKENQSDEERDDELGTSNPTFTSTPALESDNTFLTGVGLEMVTNEAIPVVDAVSKPTNAKRWGGGDFNLKVKGGELQAAVEDTHNEALLHSTQEMPEKVHIHEIMNVTTDVINLTGRSKKVWDSNFRSETTQAIIKVPLFECTSQPFVFTLW